MNELQREIAKQINIQALKQTATQVQQAQREEALRKLQEEEARRQLEIRRQQNEADAIIRQVPYKLQEAVSKGYQSTNILELESNDFQQGKYFQLKKENLALKARIVWDFLEEAGLNPQFYDEHDGYGEKSWHYIRAHL